MKATEIRDLIFEVERKLHIISEEIWVALFITFVFYIKI